MKPESPLALRDKDNSLIKFFIWLMAVTLVIRCISLGLYPLMDTTEARYGEMARIMFESGNWITPMFDYDVPFWGKPPLFTWLSASGFSLLGVNEFAARIPHFLTGLATLLLIWQFALRGNISTTSDSKALAWLSCGILASTGAFIIISGAVMTDTALMFAVTLSMLAFWMHWHNPQKKFWGYLFFAGLALGMLAKGPLAIVLCGISLSLWLCGGQRWKRLPRCLPWFSGSLLFGLLSLPWYIAAEFATPGFLDYFLIGEHFKRFVVSGWEGDLYGSAHVQPRGTIWLFWCYATFPWIPLFIVQSLRYLKGRHSAANKTPQQPSGDISFLWCWMLAPLLLFTLSGNILWSYVLPGIPAFGLLLAIYQQRCELNPKAYWLGLLMPLLLVTMLYLLLSGATGKSSEKPLLHSWREQPEQQTTLVYLQKRPFSAQFYSAGEARFNPASLAEYLKTDPTGFIVAPTHQVNAELLSAAGCQKRASGKDRSLLYCPGT